MLAQMASCSEFPATRNVYQQCYMQSSKVWYYSATTALNSGKLSQLKLQHGEKELVLAHTKESHNLLRLLSFIDTGEEDLRTLLSSHVIDNL